MSLYSKNWLFNSLCFADLKSYQELIKHSSENTRPTTVFIQCYLITVDLQQSTAMTPTESPFYPIFSPREGEGDKLNTVICKY